MASAPSKNAEYGSLQENGRKYLGGEEVWMIFGGTIQAEKSTYMITLPKNTEASQLTLETYSSLSLSIQHSTSLQN